MYENFYIDLEQFSFEWDDEKAGEKYRLIQATNIISSISVVIEEEPIKKQKIYFSIKSDEKEGRKFKNIKDILEDDEDYKALLNKARKEFETCKDNYDKLIKREDLKDIIFDIYREI
jgi:DnaJ-domain-containing protein 1